jgi:glutathione S-transferase
MGGEEGAMRARKGANMGRWASVEEARQAGGLRLVLTVGVPGPWGENAKGILHVKRIPHLRVIQQGGQSNQELREWTGESNAPQLIQDDQPALDRWSDILFLAERIAPDPPLIPDDPADRALMFGLLHELCGEQGFGWSRRMMLFEPSMSLPDDHPVRALLDRMAARYGYNEAAVKAAPQRAADILGLLGRQLSAQHEAGRSHLVGDRLSALDIAWAAFAALLEPLPEDVCAMPQPLRQGYGAGHPLMDAAQVPALLAHRQLIYEKYLELPIDLGV